MVVNLAEAASSWLNRARETRTLKPRTVEGYAYCLGLLVQHGFKEVGDLTVERVAQFLENRRVLFGTKPQTLNRHLAAVCSFLDSLERRGEFRARRIDRLRRLRYDVPPSPPPFFLTASKEDQVIDSSGRVDAQLHRAVVLDLATGMRASELAQVRHEELRLNEEHPYALVARDAERDPKTYEARTVPVRKKDAERLLALGLGGGREGPVFPAEKANSSDIYLRANTLGRRLAIVRAIVPDLGGKLDFLTLRHTFASRHVGEGKSIFKVSRWLGHRSVKTTEKHYAALAPGGDPECEAA